MLHYAVYRRCSDTNPEPEPGAQRTPSGIQPRPDDDVFGAPGGRTTLPSRGRVPSGLRGFSGPPPRRPGSGAFSGPGSPRQPARRLSGGESDRSSPKSPRLDHHSDISVARRDLEKQAADLANDKANFRRQ
jgi:hypothetical protein